MKCFAEEHFRKVNYLSVTTHTVYSACGDLKCCLSGHQITSPPLKRLLSKDAQSDMHSLCEFAVALTVSQNALHPVSVKCVSEREIRVMRAWTMTQTQLTPRNNDHLCTWLPNQSHTKGIYKYQLKSALTRKMTALAVCSHALNELCLHFTVKWPLVVVPQMTSPPSERQICCCGVKTYMVGGWMWASRSNCVLEVSDDQLNVW